MARAESSSASADVGRRFDARGSRAAGGAERGARAVPRPPDPLEPRLQPHGHSRCEELVDRHLVESLALRPLLRGERIADVGTGAGLPGVPLAIADPERAFTLIESRAKRVRFLRHVDRRARPAQRGRRARPGRALTSRAAVCYRARARGRAAGRAARDLSESDCAGQRPAVAHRRAFANAIRGARARLRAARRRARPRGAARSCWLEQARSPVGCERTEMTHGHRSREPEGRRRQDDDLRESRGVARRDAAPRAARRPRSAGERDDGLRRRQERARAHDLRRAARRFARRASAPDPARGRLHDPAEQSGAHGRRDRARDAARARVSAQARARRRCSSGSTTC